MDARLIALLKTLDAEVPVKEYRDQGVTYIIDLPDPRFCISISRKGIFLRRHSGHGVCLSRDPENVATARQVLLQAVKVLRALEEVGGGIST